MFQFAAVVLLFSSFHIIYFLFSYSVISPPWLIDSLLKLNSLFDVVLALKVGEMRLNITSSILNSYIYLAIGYSLRGWQSDLVMFLEIGGCLGCNR